MPRLNCAPTFLAPVFLAASLAVTVLSGATEAAEKYGMSGAPRGGPFSFTCPAGNYVVGIAGRVGDKLDHMAPLCAPWADGQLGNQIVGMPYGASLEGTPTSAICTGATAVGALESNIPFVSLTCVGVLSPHKPDGVPHEFGSNKPGGQNQKSVCPPDQLAVGIKGHAGQYVSAIDLICGPAPQK